MGLGMASVLAALTVFLPFLIALTALTALTGFLACDVNYAMEGYVLAQWTVKLLRDISHI